MLATSPLEYAHTDKSKAYHLMWSKTKTLCGLSVLPLLLETDLDAPLHLVHTPPASCLICKHCTRVQRELKHSCN